MRVLHLVARSHRRGAEVVALELASALDLGGHDNDVHAIALATNAEEIATLPPLVRSTRLGALTYLRSAHRLRRLLADEPVDVIVAHGGSAAVVVALAAPSAPTARVWQRILGFPEDRWGFLRRHAWAAVARRFHGIVALTTEMEAEVRSLGFEGPVWLLPNARDPLRFANTDRLAASAALRAELRIGHEVPLLGFVGHLVDQKQPELAVDVLAEVRRQGHPAHLVVVGDGPRRSAVERRIRAHGLEKSVTLLGHRDDPELIFGGVEMALITSKSEGIPGVAIEAQMTGCPVVTFRLGAVEDVVEDGVTGVIVRCSDPLLMARHVVALLGEPERLASMGCAAAKASGGFTTAVTAAQYAARFADLRDGGLRIR
ncbi:MAG: glycosyltransferase family 4 protein [Acidimicrobiales bacterium]